ncbi:MAG: Rieske 2Fe-2S domain-containing protein [Planctomycetaceae bacterium]|jgi:nitrite reductase/ring-hydroxylating ferredoxin subunit|nr:Rieske 2Fe-2S domain-containing protein [Planctomycetaceae bacterium]
MFSKLFGLFGGKPVRIPGTAKIGEGESRRVTIGDPLADGLEIIVGRVEGKLCALDRRCPHEGGRLVDGPLAEGRYMVCPLHNYRFDPKNGRAVGVVCSDAKTYRIREQDGDADVWL